MNMQLDWMQKLVHGPESGAPLPASRIQLLCELAYAESVVAELMRDQNLDDWGVEAYSLTEEHIEKLVERLNTQD